MDFSSLYNKLPKKIRKSEKFLLYMMRFAKFIHSKGKSKSKPNDMLNFIIKNTNLHSEGTLRDIQMTYVELLRFIDNVCKKHDLEYCLIYGTLLGSIRHEGFIPWDDDCDIMMMRTDYNKLIKIIPDELKRFPHFKENCGLTILTNYKDNYFKDFRSVYDSELGHEKYFEQPHIGKSTFLQLSWLKPMVKLDIFPFDYIKEESIDYYNKNYLGHKYYFRQLYHEKDFDLKKEFNERYEKLGLTENETNYIAEPIDGTCFDDFGAFDKDYIFPLKTSKFEGYEFKCPNKPDKLCELWYGETYMDIPTTLRIHQFNDYNLTLFDSKSEMDKSFEDTINYLKEINENFE